MRMGSPCLLDSLGFVGGGHLGTQFIIGAALNGLQKKAARKAIIIGEGEKELPLSFQGRVCVWPARAAC